MTSGSGGPEVPGYRDLRMLGRGGFATVYRARQVAVDREVALKVLDGAHSDERTRQLFTRECRAAGSLSWHPHVVVVHDAGTTPAGAPFLAMELLPGGSLADRLDATGPLPSDEAVRTIADVASALAAAHDADLLHRDVKPANVLVDRLGRAKLADFGIARLVGAGSATATGAVTGTVSYMAPEVLKGERATPASDVYALGLTLHTLLAGRNPLSVEGDDSPFVVIARVVAGEPIVPPSGLPGPVGDLLAACTSATPGARPTAAEVAATLGGTAPVPPPPPPTPPVAPPPRVGALVGPATRAQVPPPPASAVGPRSDHTSAEAPPARPPDPPTAMAPPTAVAPAPPLEPPGRRRGRAPLVVAAVLVVLALGATGVLVTRGGDGGDDPASGRGPTSDVARSTEATTPGAGQARREELLTPSLAEATGWDVFNEDGDDFVYSSTDDVFGHYECGPWEGVGQEQATFEIDHDEGIGYLEQSLMAFPTASDAEAWTTAFTGTCGAEGLAASDQVDVDPAWVALDTPGDATWTSEPFGRTVTRTGRHVTVIHITITPLEPPDAPTLRFVDTDVAAAAVARIEAAA